MTSETQRVRIDLHVHSECSDAPYSWWLRKLEASECYTPIEAVYFAARARGMNLVTLTDHDTIHGAEELVETFPNDTFISEEVSAAFPEDGCIVHLIAIDIDSKQHAEIQRRRRDIYELIAYMRDEQICNFWAHPLSAVNGRLTPSHIERCLLMFETLELRNGTRDAEQEQRLRELVDGFDARCLEVAGKRYPHVPVVAKAGHYGFVGGSDDHGGLAIGRAFTEYRGEANAAGLVSAIRSRLTTACGEAGRASTLAHNAAGVVGGFLRKKGRLDAGSDGPSVITSAIDRRKELIESTGVVLNKATLAARGHSDAFQQKVAAGFSMAAVSDWRATFSKLSGALADGRLGAIADSLPEMATNFMFELPYLIAARHHARDRQAAARLVAELAPKRQRPLRIAIATDTVDDTNGVALGLRRLVKRARELDYQIELLGVGRVDDAAPDKAVDIDEGGVRRVPSLADPSFSEYRELSWSIPHLASLVNLIADQRYDLLVGATPGPLGVCALASAKLMGIPFVAQYHTDLPAYVGHHTGDPSAVAAARLLLGAFYRATDATLIPSLAMRPTLEGLGVNPERIHPIRRGIDLGLFSARPRTPDLFRAYGGREPTILCVSRLSSEKNLGSLIDAHNELSLQATLVFIGDGPARTDLETRAGDRLGSRVLFLGRRNQEELARFYASADVFALPSETETFGNVVIEAQACGLPVVVADEGAASEHVVNGVTGIVCDATSLASLKTALETLIGNTACRQRMSEAAKLHALRYDLDEVILDNMALYRRLARTPHKGKTARLAAGAQVSP